MIMETLTSILHLLLLAMNMPMAIALLWGLKLHTDSTCPEGIRSVRHNLTALKVISVADVVIALTLIIASTI